MRQARRVVLALASVPSLNDEVSSVAVQARTVQDLVAVPWARRRSWVRRIGPRTASRPASSTAGTGSVSFIRLIRPLPGLGLPTRKRALLVCDASFGLLAMALAGGSRVSDVRDRGLRAHWSRTAGCTCLPGYIVRSAHRDAWHFIRWGHGGSKYPVLWLQDC